MRERVTKRGRRLRILEPFEERDADVEGTVGARREPDFHELAGLDAALHPAVEEAPDTDVREPAAAARKISASACRARACSMARSA